MGGGGGVKTPIVYPISPSADLWGVLNPLELKFTSIMEGSVLGTVPSIAYAVMTIDAIIYDTHIGSLPRTERVMDYVLDVDKGMFFGGVIKYKLVLGDEWEGTYTPLLVGPETAYAGMFGPPTAGAESLQITGSFKRKSALQNGTPVVIKFGTYVSGGKGDPVLTYFYAWWFGMGDKEAWYWPRSGESAQFVGKRMPPPFDKVSPVFQVADRDDKSSVPRYKIPARYAGVDGSTPDGRVVKAATVTQAVVKSQGRQAPPVFNTGPL